MMIAANATITQTVNRPTFVKVLGRRLGGPIWARARFWSVES